MWATTLVTAGISGEQCSTPKWHPLRAERKHAHWDGVGVCEVGWLRCICKGASRRMDSLCLFWTLPNRKFSRLQGVAKWCAAVADGTEEWFAQPLTCGDAFAPLQFRGQLWAGDVGGRVRTSPWVDGPVGPNQLCQATDRTKYGPALRATLQHNCCFSQSNAHSSTPAPTHTACFRYNASCTQGSCVLQIAIQLFSPPLAKAVHSRGSTDSPSA